MRVPAVLLCPFVGALPVHRVHTPTRVDQGNRFEKEADMNGIEIVAALVAATAGGAGGYVLIRRIARRARGARRCNI